MITQGKVVFTHIWEVALGNRLKRAVEHLTGDFKQSDQWLSEEKPQQAAEDFSELASPNQPWFRPGNSMFFFVMSCVCDVMCRLEKLDWVNGDSNVLQTSNLFC